VAKLTDTEILERALFKAVRSQTRLKYSIKADRELFRTLPGLKQEFEAAVKAGTAREFVTSKITEIADAV